MSAELNPFVKWAGGKKQLLDRLCARLPQSYNRYYEPFIGGGALFLAIQPKEAIIGDVNEQLLNVYVQLQKNAGAVITVLKEYDQIVCNKSVYLEMRALYNQKISSSVLDVECAALTIWINKHCFNGLYRVNSKGLFNVPYNNKITGSSMEENNLKGIGEFLNFAKVEIRHSDFEKTCSDVKAGDLVYFDSPYVPVSETANFTDYAKDGFEYKDHLRLARLFKLLDKQGVQLMLSNHNVALVHELYSDFRIEEIDVRRSINRDATKRVGKEVIIRNY